VVLLLGASGRPASQHRSLQSRAEAPRRFYGQLVMMVGSGAGLAEPFGLCQVQEAGQIDQDELVFKAHAVGSLSNEKLPAKGKHSTESTSVPTQPQPSSQPDVGRTADASVRAGHNGVPSLPLPSQPPRGNRYVITPRGSSAQSPRGNRYVITPRGSYIDYSIENAPLMETSDGVCPSWPLPLHAAVWPLVRIFSFTISVSTRTDAPCARQTEAADPTENQRHACCTHAALQRSEGACINAQVRT